MYIFYLQNLYIKQQKSNQTCSYEKYNIDWLSHFAVPNIFSARMCTKLQNHITGYRLRQNQLLNLCSLSNLIVQRTFPRVFTFISYNILLTSMLSYGGQYLLTKVFALTDGWWLRLLYKYRLENVRGYISLLYVLIHLANITYGDHFLTLL